MTRTDIRINLLDSKNPEPFWLLLEKFGFSKDRDYYEHAVERHEKGELEILVAVLGGQGFVGYCLLNWEPKYAYFNVHNIPEIQDLNVLGEHRNHGVGTALIRYCEEKALSKKKLIMGIGVGLDRSFGAAQRLYVRMGYVPDGNGLSYDRKPVTAGEFRPVDENLCLMMTKSLDARAQRS